MRRLPGPLQYLVMALATIPLATLVLVLAALGRRRAAYRPIHAWCRLLLACTGVRYRVEGLERLPEDGRYLIISNHSSHLDGPTLIVALRDPIYFVIKRELARIPLWGQTIVRAGFIPVDRSDSDRARRQMAAAAVTVREGRVVLVFPEGTRCPDDGMLPFKKGGFHLAVDAGVPVVPVTVNGSRTLLPKGALIPRPGEIEIVVGEPIPTEGLSKERLSELIRQTRAAIARERRRDPSFTGAPSAGRAVDPGPELSGRASG